MDNFDQGMTLEEADAAYDAAPSIPMSDEEINRIVSIVTSEPHVPVLESDHGVFKFVRLETGRYKFCSLYRDHDTLLHGDDKAVSAGFVSYSSNSDKTVEVGPERSMTLGLGPLPDDQSKIAMLFGKIPTSKQLKQALHTIMEFVCENLPKDWKVEISMSHGEASMELVDPEGEEVSSDWDSDSRDLESFVKYAKDHDSDG